MELWGEVDDMLDPTHPRAEIYLRMASHILYILTGEKFQGIHTTTEYFSGSSGENVYAPAVIDGRMYNLPKSQVIRSMRDTRGGVGGRVTKLYLKHKPIRKIIEIVEDGKVLDPESYTIRERAFLRKRNGSAWKMSPTNELAVTYEYGALPPTVGVEEAIKLADQFMLYEIGSDECILPETVTAVERQGVSIAVINPHEIITNGYTGIRSTDMFIKTYNPNRARVKSKIYIPGRPVGEE